MAQESRLAVTIDSRGAKRNADDLATSLERMEKAGEGATSTADGLSSSLDEQRKELSQLLGQINPTVAALGRLDDMQEKLAKFKKSGVVESDTFVEYTQRINTMREALGGTSEGMNRAGMSAKAYNAALRGLPAQFTDIAVSLQAGQAPLTVFLQQGGQLKDMFGGAGPAARAMGGYILGLVNPMTVAAASAATLGLVFYDVEKQISAFNASLFQGGANSGQTVESLAAIAKSAAALTGNLSSAKDAVIALAASGRTSEIQFRNLAQAAAAVSMFTGQSAADVGKAFGDLGDNATKAAQKISSEYGLLTAAQYEVIRGLDEQGQTQQALDTFSESLNKNAQDRLRRYRESLSEIERDWQNIGTAISNAYSQVKGEVFPDDLKQMEIAQRILDTRKEGGFVGALSNLFSFGDNTNQALREQIKLIGDRRTAAAASAKAEADITNREQRRIETSRELADLAKSARTQTQKLQDDLKDLEKTRSESIKNGGFGAKEEADYAKARKNIEQGIADIKEREAKKNAPKNPNRGVAEAENTFSRLYAQYDPASQAARALTKEQQQLDLTFEKGKISQEEYGKALAQASANYAAAIKGAQGLTQAEQYRAQMERMLATERMEYAAKADAVGMGQKDAARMQERLQLEQEANNRILQLQTELANAKGEKQRQDLQAQIDLEREYLGKRVAVQREGWAQLDQAQSSWSAGARGAFQDYLDSARDVAGQSRAFFTNAFSSMEDAVANFAISGKLSFSDFTKSILADMARIATRQAASGIFASIAGSALGGWLGGGANGLASGSAGEVSSKVGASAAGYSPKFGFSSGGYTGDGGKFEPKGVVHGGEYVIRKEVVSQPGMRDHLDRLNKKGYASGGYVSSAPGGQGQAPAATINMPMNISVRDRSDEGMQLDQQALQQNLQAQQTQMRAIAEDAIARSWRPGGTSFRQKSGRA